MPLVPLNPKPVPSSRRMQPLSAASATDFDSLFPGNGRDSDEAEDAESGSLRKFWEQTGLNAWVDKTIAPALHLRVRKGFKVDIVKGKTADGRPQWTITPTRASMAPRATRPPPVAAKAPQGASGSPLISLTTAAPAKGGKKTVGVLPLIPIAKVGIDAFSTGQRHLRNVDSDPWGMVAQGDASAAPPGYTDASSPRSPAAAKGPLASGLTAPAGDLGDAGVAIGMSLDAVGDLSKAPKGGFFDLIDSDGYTVDVRTGRKVRG